VTDVGQIEVDEIYLGVNKRGAHFVIPCQAKSPGDRFGIVQVMQDILLCQEKFPSAICRPVALQFQGINEVAILELAISKEADMLRLNVVDEKHYKLSLSSDISPEQIRTLRDREEGFSNS
jgi:hypothetical protein